MQVALVYPPSTPPTSPPCGIAYLKSYVQTGKTFDLNLSYHEIVLDMLKKGSLSVEADIQGHVLGPEHLAEAVQIFKGKDFYDPETYNRNALLFLTYFQKIDSYFREELMKYLFEDSAGDEALTLLQKLTEPVKNYHPDLVGFSQMIFSQRDFILGLAKYLKDIPIVVGGAALSQNPESYLSEIGVKLKVDLSTIFDAAFYGEGELPLKAYLEGENPEKIPNMVYKKEEIRKNDEIGLSNLDVLPVPDFSDFPLRDYYSPEIVLPLLTSRGCYWMRCTFCVHYKSYYKYRTRSTEKVVSDLKELQKKYKASHFLFADEMIHPRRFEELSGAILKENLSIRYYSEVKPVKDFTDELLRRMFLSGARVLLWGVESGTQRILDVIDKGTCVEDIEKVLKDSHNAGIWNMVFMIMGYPTQTEDEVKGDIAFLKRNEDYISTLAKSLFQLEVGSRIHENPERFSVEKIERSPDPFSTACRYSTSRGVSNREAERMYRENTEILNISRISPHFGNFRDHMLLFADNLSRNSQLKV